MARVLVIEDDIAIARALEKKLVLAGHHVNVLLHGETSVTFIRALKPDIVLLDLLLPEHSGLEVLHELRASTDLANIPIIILSNFSGEEMKKATQDLGISNYLVKSETTLDVVASEVEKALAR